MHTHPHHSLGIRPRIAGCRGWSVILRCTTAAAMLATFGPALTSAQPMDPDFSAITALGEGAVIGENVETPVPGFEILLMVDGQTLYHRAFGAWTVGRLANADSATKTLSGAVIMTLVDRGEWTLQSRLGQFLPEFNSGLKANITISQAFSHCSGIASNAGSPGNPALTLRQAAAEIGSLPLRYVPGSTFSYGGSSMHCAGAAAEVASGQSWNALYLQRIALPLGLTQTRYTFSTAANPLIAGGCESTGAEFAVFMETLRRGGLTPPSSPGGPTRVLSESAVAALISRQTPLDVRVANSPSQDGSADYGVGMWLGRRDSEGNLIGCLAAGARGFSSWIDLDDRMVGVFATDLSASGNVQTLLALLQDAAQAAVRAARCPADLNLSGGLDPDDLGDYLNCYFGDSECTAADFNRDGNTNPDDLGDYINAYFAGCA